MKQLMRYNDYQHDKLSGSHPVASVCARGDLEAEGAVPKGCYDTKVWGVLNRHMCGNPGVAGCQSRACWHYYVDAKDQTVVLVVQVVL
jgi:hypothetical protein